MSEASTDVAVTALTLTISTEEEETPAPRVLPPAVEAVIESVSVPSPPARLSPALRVVVATVAAVAMNESSEAPPVSESTPVVSELVGG